MNSVMQIALKKSKHFVLFWFWVTYFLLLIEFPKKIISKRYIKMTQHLDS